MSQQPEYDFSDTLRAKSDQLNADDLMGGSITVQIIGFREGDKAEQPLWLRLSGGHQPWKPCKTMRRLLAAAVGSSKASALVGRWVTLYRDPTVTFGGNAEGGVRLSHMSGLDRPCEVRLQVSRGKKGTFRVLPLREPDQRQQGAPTADLDRVLEDAGLTVADLDAYLVAAGKPAVADLDAEKRAGIAVWLANPANQAKVRPANAQQGEE